MNNTYWEYSYDYDNKLIYITHTKLKLHYSFNMNNDYWHGYACDDFFQSKFDNKLSDLDLIQVLKTIFRHNWDPL